EYEILDVGEQQYPTILGGYPLCRGFTTALWSTPQPLEDTPFVVVLPPLCGLLLSP
ncbi:8234_t:CDS:1, partial [Racocetra persica]